MIYHGVNGFVYPQKSWQALAHGMVSISTDALLYMTLSRYRDTLQEFDTGYMIKKHYELYQSL